MRQFTGFLFLIFCLPGFVFSVPADLPETAKPSMYKTKGKFSVHSGDYPSSDWVRERQKYRANPHLNVATFAGGCFWGIEAEFEKMPGVREVFSGFMGGHVDNPAYREVSQGGTDHYEVVEIYYDPQWVSYRQLVEKLWRISDPTNGGYQRGNQYASAIFYHNDSQRSQAQKSLAELKKSGVFNNPIKTRVAPATSFYLANNWHQDHYLHVPGWYKNYQNSASSREHRIWGKKEVYIKPADHLLKDMLTPLQYAVTQKGSTEYRNRNEYWNNKAAGIYVDIVTGEPLFSSRDKYDSGTGWPSFTRPLVDTSVVESDTERTDRLAEVSSYSGRSHLGHVFFNEPTETGRRYCINSAAIRFIRKEDLVKEGYGRFLPVFENKEEQVLNGPTIPEDLAFALEQAGLLRND